MEKGQVCTMFRRPNQSAWRGGRWRGLVTLEGGAGQPGLEGLFLGVHTGSLPTALPPCAPLALAGLLLCLVHQAAPLALCENEASCSQRTGHPGSTSE